MINFNSIRVTFNGLSLFDNFSLRIGKGQKIIITGKSGTGKSTLLKLIPGLAPVSSGSVTVDSTVLCRKTVHDIRKKISYVSQGVDIFGDTVQSFLNRIFTFKANSHLKFDTEKIKDLFDCFELPDVLMKRNIDDLSGGEKQRVALVAAVLLERHIFLLDEPTASLDVHLKQKVASYFLSNQGWTVLAISHDREWLHDPSATVLKLGEHAHGS
ncbi:MAG: ABC transporter ATP-binding protein [Candidatus Auribacterota bacterium]|jgi:putative ABC transport system ATP-binding protein|nr:ABC transporter ATP-binding protein [Candidatus Auribacterota bacterium]